LQKPSHQRTVFDIKMLVKCTESVKFFADMVSKDDDSTTHEQCCRVMVHKFYHGGDVVFKEGTEGSTFFIILKGSIGVYVPESRPNISKIPTEHLSTDSPRNKKTSIVSAPIEHAPSFKFKLLRMNSKLDEPITGKMNSNANPNGKITSLILDKKPSLSGAKFKEFMSAMVRDREKGIEVELNRVKILTQGMSFGELALLDNKPRSATIICEEDCHFAVLEKKAFLEILSNFYGKILDFSDFV